MPGFNGLGKDNCKTRRKSFTCWDLVHLTPEVLRGSYYELTKYTPYLALMGQLGNVSCECFAWWQQDTRASVDQYPWLHAYPASIATLAQRRHWSASSRSAADAAPTLVFCRLRYYGMLAVGARRLAYRIRSLPMFCVWTSVVGIKCFSNKCCRSTRLSIHQLHI